MAAAKHPDLNELRLCIDRPVALERKVHAAQAAIAENPQNEPPQLPLMPGASANVAKISFFTGKIWANGRNLGVRFLDGSAKQKKLTQKYAERWLEFANLKLDFNAGAKAEIRISFQQQGSWSAVGTDCLADDFKGEATMNFGWLRDDTDEEEWRRVVTHEFGHAFGAIHEHQVPSGGIQWNLNEVYRVFSGPPNNWTKQQIDFNIVQKYSASQLNGTKFDRLSIMLYQFPGNLIVGGVPTPNNTDFSPTDKTFVAGLYPKPGDVTVPIKKPKKTPKWHRPHPRWASVA
jgi:hypothetical protein